MENKFFSIAVYCLSGIAFFFHSCKEEKKAKALPYIGNYDVVTSSVNGQESIDTIYPKIPHFSGFRNQIGKKISSKDLKGKVWIANFFFTSCPSICPPMIAQMKRLNLKTQDLNEHLQFISFSIDPKTDSPSKLKEYMTSNGILTENWIFLTGDEKKTHELGVKHFYIHAASAAAAPGGFAHSDGLVLVDKSGFVRGVYRGTQTEQVNLLEKDIRKLLKIEYGIDSKK